MKILQAADVCPSPESWLRLLANRSPDAERISLEDHLGGCEACRLAVDELAGLLDVRTRERARPDLSPILDPIAGLDRWPDEAETPPEIPGFSDFEEIGRGGMGIVYRARQDELNRTVAVKVLSRFGPSTRERVAREARTMARLKHPNAVAVHWTGRIEGTPYIVMEWVEGGTLQDRIGRGPLDPREAATLVIDLAGAVSRAHELGIVHRDLKPSNVLISPGPPAVPKLVDFGLALDDQSSTITGQGLILGTPGYMAPEQTGLVAGLGPVGPAADIHGLGAILYAMLSGRAPYRGDSVWETLGRVSKGDADPLKTWRADVSPALEAIVSRCLQLDPARRYASASDLAADLGRFLDGVPPLACRAVKTSRLGRRISIAALVVSGLGAAILGASRATHSPKPPIPAVAPAGDLDFRDLGAFVERVNAFKPDFEHPLGPADQSFLTLVRDRFRNAPVGSDPWLARTFARSTAGTAEKVYTLAKELNYHKSYSDARLALEATVAMHRHGVRLDPDSEEREGKLLEAEEALFWVLKRWNWGAPAEALAREMVEFSRGKTDLSFVRGYKLMLGQRFLTVVLPVRGAYLEAEQVHAELVPILARLRSQKEEDKGIISNQLGAMFDRAENFEKLGRMEDALRKWYEYEDMAGSLGEDFFDGFESRVALSTAFGSLAAISLKLGRVEDARTYALKRAEVARLAAEKRPDNEALLDDSTKSALAILDYFPATDRPAEVAKSLRSALDLEECWARANPSRSDRKIPLDALATGLGNTTQ